MPTLTMLAFQRCHDNVQGLSMFSVECTAAAVSSASAEALRLLSTLM